MNGLVYATFLESQRLGVSLGINEQGRLSATFPAGARRGDIDALRQRLGEQKDELVQMLATNPNAQPLTRMVTTINVDGKITREITTEITAVQVWSEALQAAIWVIADGEPPDAYLADGLVFTHLGVRVLLEQSSGIKVWTDLSPTESAA